VRQLHIDIVIEVPPDDQTSLKSPRFISEYLCSVRAEVVSCGHHVFDYL